MRTRSNPVRWLRWALPAVAGLCACGGAVHATVSPAAGPARSDPVVPSTALAPAETTPSRDTASFGAAVPVAIAKVATHEPQARPEATGPTEPAGEGPGGRDWIERVLVSHPLVGRIYQPAQHAFVTRAELDDALLRARYVLLGEKHDNRDHHRLQTSVLGQLLRSRHSVAVAFEMFDTSQQPALDQYLAAGRRDVDGMAELLRWDDSGWPSWSMYRPLFATALEHGARIVAANLPRIEAMAIALHGRSAPELASLSLPRLPAAQLAAMEQEMREVHCDALPEAMVPGVALAQQARDATMARAMLHADHGAGTVLIAGDGHARSDRGVPVTLRAARSAAVLSVGWLEVARGHLAPEDYLDRADTGTAPYDFVWFTPRVDEQDPCGEESPPAGQSAALSHPARAWPPA
jgi:uncharacterized iron-regulated protein